MRVGIGLPTTTPGVDRDLLLEWARRADAGPLSSLGVLDRLAYDSWDPFASLAAAGAVTERVGLVTMVVVAPLRNAAVLGKEAATLDALSRGRLTLGLSIGARHDDYLVAGMDPGSRGRRFDEHLATIRDLWERGVVGPGGVRDGGVPILIGGQAGEAFQRMARMGDGYVHGGGPPRAFASAAARALRAWRDFERPGRPALWGQGYFALGGRDEVERGAAYLRDYYAFTGSFAERVAAGNLTTPQAVVEFVRGYEDAGCDELVLLPTVSDIVQVDRLAEVVASL